MILYRGTSKNKCEIYRKMGIPKGEKFTNKLKEARRFSKGCIIKVNLSKKSFEPSPDNLSFKAIKLGTRYYKNEKVIKRFKIQKV